MAQRPIPFLLAAMAFALPGLLSATPAGSGEASAPPPQAQLPSAFMALEEVEPGMRGEWRTVVSGTGIDSFELEVLGVVENFIGPRRSVIICRALTPSQIESGPVSGMSGSPVYIDGRLVGAYAYGYTWPKEQAIIGVTPIGQMLEVFEYPVDEEAFNPGRGKQYQRAASQRPEEASAFTPRQGGGAATPERLTRARLKPLPTPVMASGIAPEVLAAFEEEFRARGLEVMAAPMGNAEGDTNPGLTAEAIEPGAAVAGVLMQGDFNFAATGTVTWREGDRLLAFGHPFLQSGPVAMPMAPAEVVTVVQTVPGSFKMSRVGPIVGSIYQDRLTAIAGEVGKAAPLSDVSISVHPENGPPQRFAARMFHSEDFSPLLAAISVLQSLSSTMQAEERQSVFLEAELKLEGMEAVRWESVASGPNSDMSTAMEVLRELGRIMNNPFTIPAIESLDINVSLRNEWSLSRLRSLQVLSGRPGPGGEVRVGLTVQNYLGLPERREVRVPVPETVRPGETLHLYIGDAAGADRIDLGTSRPDFDSLEDYLEHLRARRSNQAIYVKLMRAEAGLRVEGTTLPALPPSARGLMVDPRSRQPMASAGFVTLWEDHLELPGNFSGREELTFEVE